MMVELSLSLSHGKTHHCMALKNSQHAGFLSSREFQRSRINARSAINSFWLFPLKCVKLDFVLTKPFKAVSTTTTTTNFNEAV